MSQVGAYHTLFAKVCDCQEETTVLKLCNSASTIVTPDSVLGSQRVGLLWLLYVNTDEAKAKILKCKFVVDSCVIKWGSTNPLLSKDGRTLIKTTRMSIDNVPLVYSDNVLMKFLSEAGVTCMSRVTLERVRDEEGRLTHWLTGRRFVWIQLPTNPLPRNLPMRDTGITARLFYREQADTRRQCYNCMRSGHLAAECTAPVVCRVCSMPGHRQGDAVCTGAQHETQGLQTRSDDIVREIAREKGDEVKRGTAEKSVAGEEEVKRNNLMDYEEEQNGSEEENWNSGDEDLDVDDDYEDVEEEKEDEAPNVDNNGPPGGKTGKEDQGSGKSVRRNEGSRKKPTKVTLVPSSESKNKEDKQSPNQMSSLSNRSSNPGPGKQKTMEQFVTTAPKETPKRQATKSPLSNTPATAKPRLEKSQE